MATSKIPGPADDLADDISAAGKKAQSGARSAGESVGDAVSNAAESGARSVRQQGRRGERAYREAGDDFDARVGSLEESIRRNPLASAGAALFVGVLLGRFIL
jgi:ElaB/YqjD/DUF883 family membrane-anchored ribosome-binding protein